MITGPGGLHARCVGCGALPQPSHGDANDRAPGAVDGSGDRALGGRRHTPRASGSAGQMLSSSGAQT